MKRIHLIAHLLGVPCHFRFIPCFFHFLHFFVIASTLLWFGLAATPVCAQAHMPENYTNVSRIPVLETAWFWWVAGVFIAGVVIGCYTWHLYVTRQQQRLLSYNCATDTYAWPRSDQQWQNLLDFCPQGMLIMDEGGIIHYANQKAHQLLNRTSLYGEVFGLFISQHEWCDVNVVTCEGTITLELRCQATEWEGKHCTIISMNDVTKRIQLEEDMRHAQEAAEAANRAKSMFLANMSHELRTPLNAIIGFTQLMNLGDDLSPEYQEYVQIINSSGEHLLELINSVLDLSKIESGHMALNKTTVNLLHVLTDLENIFRLQAQEKDIFLLIECDQDVPQHIMVDEMKLRQVLINFISNAIKFTPHGGVTVRVWNERRTPPAVLHRLCFAVEDTGSGIAPHEREKLFDAFVQTRTGQQSYQGTGLGLAISRTFVQLMGGDIHVQSEIGRGTTFTFTIEFEGENVESEETDLLILQSDSVSQQIAGLAPEHLNHRILIVDDVYEMRLVLVKLLVPLGFDVREAENGQDALAIWREWKPHVILMDMSMPILDGYEATKYIKAHANGYAPVVIALTASSFEEDDMEIQAYGCDDVVHKPFHIDHLLRVLQKHLSLRYLYHEKIRTPSTGSQSSVAIAEYLIDIPLAWVDAMNRAALLGSPDTVQGLIYDIREEHSSLATELQYLVDHFKFDQIVAATEHVINHTCAGTCDACESEVTSTH